MTIKELFKKIDTYNEVVEMLGGEKRKIHIQLGHDGEWFDSYKSFTKYAKANYADDLYEAVTTCGEFKFGEAYELAFTCYGYDMVKDIEINAFTC